MDKPIIQTTKIKSLSVVVQYVFRASFNDTYWLEEKIINLDDLDRDKLTWFDPYNGRSNIGDTLVSLSYCSDDKFIILEKRNGVIKEITTENYLTCIICEDFDDDKLLAAHINIK